MSFEERIRKQAKEAWKTSIGVGLEERLWVPVDVVLAEHNKDMAQLKTEIVAELTNGWTESERLRQWNTYLNEEIKPYYPALFEFLKGEVAGK